MPSAYDVIIIGGGAAGLMCALTARQRGKSVALLEHNDRIGKKIAISGGGRCNFTNLSAGPENYLSGHADFCRSALARYTPWDFVALVEKHGIAYHEKKLGQQFCDGSSRQIIEMLIKECAGVDIRCGCRVTGIEKAGSFALSTSLGPMECGALVIATGELSFAKLGATDFGYQIARQFGLRVTDLRPGLVPLTFAEEDRPLSELSGMALPVRVRNERTSFEESMLFTHRGLSGPAILQISSFWHPGDTLHFDLLPEGQDLSSLTPSEIAGVIGEAWPKRFATKWRERHAAVHKPQEIDKLVHQWPMKFSGTEGYPKAEVTLGGVDTGELSSKTMESRKVPGLFFIGEVVDVTGWLGGYNFQWAWASGHAAGEAV